MNINLCKWWLLLSLLFGSGIVLAEGTEGCHAIVRPSDTSLSGMIVDCPVKLSFLDAHYEDGTPAVASELHLHVGERVIFPRRDSVEEVAYTPVEAPLGVQSEVAASLEWETGETPTYKNVLTDLGRSPFGYVKSDVAQVRAVRIANPYLSLEQAKEIVRNKRAGRGEIKLIPCGSVINGNFLMKGGRHLSGGTLLACGKDKEHPYGNPEKLKIVYEFCSDDGQACAYQFEDCMNWFGDWTPPKRPPEPKVPEEPVIPKRPIVPTPTVPMPIQPQEEPCRYEPTAFVLGGVVANGNAAAGFGHVNLAQHCMKKIGPGEYLGVGIQGLYDGSIWSGKELDHQPEGTYVTHRPRIGLPSFRYWKRTEDHQFAALGGPTVGAVITEGGSDNGQYDMFRAQGTIGLGGNLDIYSRDEDGRFVKDWQLSGGIDVPFTTFEKEHSWNGKPLPSKDLKSLTAIATLGVRKHFFSDCRPDLPLGGYRIYGQVDGFLSAPETAAVGAYVVATDCGYRLEARVGPSINLETGDVSGLAAVGVNALEVARHIEDQGRVDQVTEQLQQRDQQQ